MASAGWVLAGYLIARASVKAVQCNKWTRICAACIASASSVLIRYLFARAGVVRISAYDDADLSAQPSVRAGKCDMMLFPSGERMPASYIYRDSTFLLHSAQ